jgi:hypothetical protein
MITMSRAKLHFLGEEKLTSLNESIFFKQNRIVTPGELKLKLDFTLAESLAVFTILESENLGTRWLLILHFCTESPVAIEPFSAGPPTLPWTCPECNRLIERRDQLSLDYHVKVKEPIQFE